MARNPGRTVCIGNFDEKVPERVLYEILIQAGHVVDLYIPCDKESTRPRGYAFAEYETEEIAQYAVRLFSGLVRLNNKLLKFTIAGHDKPTSNGNQPVIPKLNPIPLPKQGQFAHHSDKTRSHTPAYPVINGHEKPTSNVSQAVLPKLNPIPLPKQSQFVHHSVTLPHTSTYPVVNGGVPGYGSSPNLNPYGIQIHPQALSGGSVNSHGQLSNDMYDYNIHSFGSALNGGYRGPVQNVLAHGAGQQPIMYPSY